MTSTKDMNKTSKRFLQLKHKYILTLLLLMTGASGAWGQTGTPTWADGVYYLKSSAGTWYLWPSEVTNSVSHNRYLTTHNAKEASAQTDKYPARDNTFCRWVVKNVWDATANKYFIQLINPKLNQYVIIYDKTGIFNILAYGDRDVWLSDNVPSDDVTRSYFWVNTGQKATNGGMDYYRLSPTRGYNGQNGNDFTNRSFNCAGGDKEGLGSGGTNMTDQRPSLIQLFNGDPKWTIEPALFPAPTINYDPNANTFTISYDSDLLPAGYDILYTTNGNDPTVGGAGVIKYGNSPVPVTGNYLVKAVIARYGVILTEMAEEYVGTVLPPTITSIGGCGNMVEITSSVGDVSIYYTLDGSAPTTGSTLYTGPFAQNTDVTIKAIACLGNLSSEIASLNYTPTYSATPIITIDGSTVTITGTGTIYYTLDGSEPTTGSTVYSSPISLRTAEEEVVIKATAKTGTKELSCVAEQTFVPAIPGYYAIHQSGTGYLRLKDSDVNLNNDGKFYYGNLFDGSGNSIWYVTPQGYLQNGYYYLNVINDQTLYLSVEPKTKWFTEAIDGNAHGKVHLRANGLYLCNDNNTITLKESPTDYYNACPITITEKSWSDPSADNLTLQSPQQVTYLRAYYTQKMDYEFYNDAGDKVSEKDKDRRVYATLTYKSGGDNKGSNWDINTTSGVIYNKTASNVDVTATYTIEPADPIAYSLHSTPGTKSIKYTLQPKSITPIDDMKYLLFSIKAGDDYRYPYDDGIDNGGLVKPDGKGGTGSTSVLTDPANPNLQISWKIQVDEEGFYTFQNLSTNKYLYYDEAPLASSDYGALRLGTVPSDNSYKFRLYKTNNADFGVCYQIIPYSKQYAVYKSDGVAKGFCAALNNNNYKSSTPVISLFNANDNSQWCIYKYEAEYRIRSDFSFSGPASTSSTGDVTFKSSDGWYGKYIKESPKTGNAQNKLAISGTYNTDKINYIWTVIDLDNYINHEGWTSRDGGVGMTYTNDKNFTFNVTSLPVSPVSGVIQLQLRGGTQDKDSATDPYKWTSKKTLGFTIMGNGEITFTDITSLSAITDPTGAYRLTADVSDRPGVTTFSGILVGNGHKVSNLGDPLFETLNNGTVRDLNLDNVSISGSGNVGAIAGTANGGSRIYNVGILNGSVGSADGYCGGLVGLLDGSARVINCFSYADITSGTSVGGIVGYNKFKTTSADFRTMVMNCMFYGDITGGTNKAPIYNGEIISNIDATGVSNFNYFSTDPSYVVNQDIDTYNCALMAEPRFLQRFEFFRHLLNSHRELAAWWATGDVANKDEMAKWVLEPSQIGSETPYPILKTPGYYPSVVNIDAENAPTTSERNKGAKLGTLSVTIRMGDGAAFKHPDGASITNSFLPLNITDKDPEHFNFNYYKVQLPYYNDVGSNNYTGNRVVTGWKIVGISGGTSGGTSSCYTTGDDAIVDAGGNITSSPYNFADRNCTQKDLYSVSRRVFNQGAYWDVPEGVTAITIEPYWAKAAYVADDYRDVVYDKGMGTRKNVETVAGGQWFTDGSELDINGSTQKVYNTINNAVTALAPSSSNTVYDYAVVLVGNVHQNGVTSGDAGKPYTIMSIDLDKDDEPDYSLIMRVNSRNSLHPVRVDFLNIPGLGMAQKSTGGTGSYNFGIMQPLGWFETTNTSLFRVTQFEYDHNDRIEAPLILQGGVIEQWVSGQDKGYSNKTTYFHVGGNVWFKEFHRGTHQDKQYESKHPPVSVTGGDYQEFYLTGLYRGDVPNYDDNAECYINGGRFGIVAGAGQEGIGNATEHTNGNIVWQIQNADIDEFYGGGFNAAHPVEGNITNVITGGYIKQFCGGPKFGDMNGSRKVITHATGCEFDKYFGAGYGGNSYSRRAPGNKTSVINMTNPTWNTWVNQEYKQDYQAAYDGVSTQINYQFLPQSDNTQNVARLWIEYVKFSLATTHDVISHLAGCTINENFYGGGNLGKVDGPVTSTLTNCTVKGNAFGAGYSATLPTVEVMNTGGFRTEPRYDENTGVFMPEVYPETKTYSWQHRDETINSTALAIDKTNHILYTNEDLSHTNLGSVSGAVNLTITGNSVIGKAGDATTGNVYGGGDQSTVNNATTPTNASTTVTISGNTEVFGNVFGGGNQGLVSGSATVNIQE